MADVSEAKAWRGIRLTLACGHFALRDHPAVMGEPPDYWVIGKLAACQVCPVRKRLTGGEVSAVRQVVKVDEVMSPRKPENLDPIHWYWEGQGH